MTIPLPHTSTTSRDVDRNFQALASKFPLESTATNFSQVPAVLVYKDANQSIASGAGAKVTFSSAGVVHDRGASSLQFDDANDQLVCRVPGLYTLYSQTNWDFTAVVSKAGRIRVNQSAVTDPHITVGVGTVTILSVVDVVLAPGDQVDLFAAHSHVAGINVVGTDRTGTYLGWRWNSP